MTDHPASDPLRLSPGDRVRFDGKATSWLVRATACDGRYAICTCSLFGDVYYSIIDHVDRERGPLNILGNGMGIFTMSGPDEGVDETVRLLEEPDGGWEISRRHSVRLSITDRKVAP